MYNVYNKANQMLGIVRGTNMRDALERSRFLFHGQADHVVKTEIRRVDNFEME